MHDNGAAKQADDRISTPGTSQAVGSNSDLPARAWGATSTQVNEGQFQLCGGQGSYSWKGSGPSAVNSTAPVAAPNYPDSGQHGVTCPDLDEIGFGRGQGFSPVVFANSPTTDLKFSLWRGLSVWRIWGGCFGRRRSRWGGVIVREDAVPVAV